MLIGDPQMLIGDPQMLIGDPQMLIGDPLMLIGDPKLFEREREPEIFNKDKDFQYESPRSLTKTRISNMRTRIFI